VEAPIITEKNQNVICVHNTSYYYIGTSNYTSAFDGLMLYIRNYKIHFKISRINHFVANTRIVYSGIYNNTRFTRAVRR